MKTCPNCHTQYTDDTLRFCLQDGATLVATPVTQQPTESFSGEEMETVARQAPVSGVTRVPPQSSGRSKTAIAVALTALVMLLLFGIGGIGLWLYFRNGDDTVKNTDNRPINQNKTPQNQNVSLSPTPSRTPTPVTGSNLTPPIPNPAPTQAADEGRMKQLISGQVQSWGSSAESGDLDAYMSHYAPVVDYYRKRNATTAFVRADKLRAFSRFDRMQVNISNVSVIVGPSGDVAQAEFDKEWDFQGNGRSKGKVRQLLRFRNINGQWRITVEKDLHIIR